LLLPHDILMISLVQGGMKKFKTDPGALVWRVIDVTAAQLQMRLRGPDSMPTELVTIVAALANADYGGKQCSIGSVLDAVNAYLDQPPAAGGAPVGAPQAVFNLLMGRDASTPPDSSFLSALACVRAQLYIGIAEDESLLLEQLDLELPTDLPAWQAACQPNLRNLLAAHPSLAEDIAGFKAAVIFGQFVKLALWEAEADWEVRSTPAGALQPRTQPCNHVCPSTITTA
jgi:hypothetical protein